VRRRPRPRIEAPRAAEEAVKKKKPAAEQRDVPIFAAEFPRDGELDALVEAFARGDYAAVRAGAPKLAASAADEDVRAAARMLRERIEPDPMGKTLILIAAVLLAFLAWWYLGHAHGPS